MYEIYKAIMNTSNPTVEPLPCGNCGCVAPTVQLRTGGPISTGYYWVECSLNGGCNNRTKEFLSKEHAIYFWNEYHARHVQTTTPLSSKDSVETPKKEVLVSNAEDKPESVSTVMPEAIKTLFEVVASYPSRNPDGSDLAWRLYVHGAFPDIRDAYQRIADLEEDLGEWKGPQWTCKGCGYMGSGFATVKVASWDGPCDYEMFCPKCEHDDIAESPKEALKYIIENNDKLTNEAEAYISAANHDARTIADLQIELTQLKSQIADMKEIGGAMLVELQSITRKEDHVCYDLAPPVQGCRLCAVEQYSESWKAASKDVKV